MKAYGIAVLTLSMTCCMTPFLCAQTAVEDPVELLKTYMSNIARSDGAIVQTVESRSILSADPALVLPELQTYEHSSNAEVRRQTFSFEWQFAIGSTDRETRRAIVERMAKACGDPEPGVRRDVCEHLAALDAQDFTPKAKTAIRSVLHSRANPDAGVVLLTGVAQMRDQTPYLRRLLVGVDEEKLDPTSRYGLSWRARLALARMGDKVQTAACIKLVQAEPDLVRRVCVLLHHLAFTRQPEVIPALNAYLWSDERLPSEKEGTPGTRSCEYALWVLARTLERFPVKDHGTVGYSQAEIDTARQWMKPQKKFEFKKRLSDRPLL